MGLASCGIIFAHHAQRIVTGGDLTKPKPGGLHISRAAAIVVARYHLANLFQFPVATASRCHPAPDPMNDDNNDRELSAELARMQQEHRDLDAAIDALHHSPAPDLLRLQRLKKRKLQLRDRIAFIEDQITPDIIA
jgi:hypothetical protein